MKVKREKTDMVQSQETKGRTDSIISIKSGREKGGGEKREPDCSERKRKEKNVWCLSSLINTVTQNILRTFSFI